MSDTRAIKDSRQTSFDSLKAAEFWLVSVGFTSAIRLRTPVESLMFLFLSRTSTSRKELCKQLESEIESKKQDVFFICSKKSFFGDK